MQKGGARQKHNAEGGREAKKFKNHCARGSLAFKVYFMHIHFCLC